MRDGNSTTPQEPADGAQPAQASGPGEPGAVQVIVGEDSTRIVLSGEVDADLASELQEATAEAEHLGLPIEVDAHHVTFMDSSGVAFLARLSIRSQHRVKLLRVPPTVRFLLEVTRIGELLDVVEDDDARTFQPVGDQTTTD
ncbi:STAS domain-containing protein [Cellulomonas edaphi]|uniref:STAS domain-containing protein n=1 Tax=Cellulomonas edaphi TaxID=3053468 RepID=A0ABT7S3Y9_9CELL|nr:STAS domain-containing protein [Cellulomons edaphi]MDM7829732.1 STAS domain-containing protein [Cellulomons edaphi]